MEVSREREERLEVVYWNLNVVHFPGASASAAQVLIDVGYST